VKSVRWAGTGQGDGYVWHESKASLDPRNFKSSPSNIKSSAKTQIQTQEAKKEQGNAFGRIEIKATVKCDGKTGVEMEALTAASVAALTVYDMCKAVDKGMRIEGLRVVRKEGGKSGTWIEGENVSE